MDKLLWAVQAGDQIGDSEDDQPCGDHFIDNDLECHEGDAHRPTPGKNPYWQGDRKGPEDKSKTPEKKGKDQPGHERDREQQTPQSKKREESLREQGYTPESYGEENVNHFADLMERAYEDKTGQKMTWDDKKISDLSEMVNEQVGRGFSKDPSEKGIHDPTAPKGFKGPKGREMSRPDSYHRETEFPREGGGMEHVPSGRGGREGGGLYDHFKETLKDRLGNGEPEGPSQEMKKEQEKWEGPGYQGEEAPDADKGYEYQERQMEEWDPSQGPEDVKPYQKKERRRQTQKEYKRRKDAERKEKRAQSASLAPQLTWGKIVQDRVDDAEENRRDRGVVDIQDSKDEDEPTTASKPMPGKATEHSGAKRGKGAWDKKKVAKKTSNKGRRAADKQASKDQTVGDESDGPFPGAAPLFKKAAAMNWTTAEPRPCYPDEEPVEDHCNDSIAPPAPGGGDDMGTTPPKGFSEQEEGPVDWDSYEGYDPDEAEDTGDDDIFDLGEDPMENAGPAMPSPDGMGPQGREPSSQDPGGPHGSRAPGLAPDAPHQFWSQEAPHVQDALNKYVIPQMDSPTFEVADKARRIFFEGPHVDFDKRDPESEIPVKGTGMRRLLDGPQGDPSLYPDEE